MKKIINSEYFELKNCEFGRGLFAIKDIDENTLIETSPILIIPQDEILLTNGTILVNYSFYIDDSQTQECIALGYGSLFNHSNQSNIKVERDKKNLVLKFYTKRYIEKNEQLFLNYGYELNVLNKQYQRIKKRLLNKLI